jgi:hypothetical protein
MTTAVSQTVACAVKCPLCHTVAPTITESALAAGADWICATCDQRWDADRLAAVARYAEFVADRASRSGLSAASTPH